MIVNHALIPIRGNAVVKGWSVRSIFRKLFGLPIFACIALGKIGIVHSVKGVIGQKYGVVPVQCPDGWPIYSPIFSIIIVALKIAASAHGPMAGGVIFSL